MGGRGFLPKSRTERNEPSKKLIGLAAEIEALPQQDEEAMGMSERQASAEVRNKLGEAQQFFTDIVEPLVKTAETNDSDNEASSINYGLLAEELEASRSEITELRAQNSQIASEARGTPGSSRSDENRRWFSGCRRSRPVV